MVYVFLMYIFKRMVCTNATPGFFYFLRMKCFIIDLHCGGNDLKATGGIETFAC